MKVNEALSISLHTKDTYFLERYHSFPLQKLSLNYQITKHPNDTLNSSFEIKFNYPLKYILHYKIVI